MRSSSAIPYSPRIVTALSIIPEAMLLASSVDSERAEAVTEKRRISGSIITEELPVTETVADVSADAQETADRMIRAASQSLFTACLSVPAQGAVLHTSGRTRLPSS